MLRYFFGFLFGLLPLLLTAQVVNVETRRMQTDSVRLAGEVNTAFLFNSTNGNTLLTFRTNAAMQVKSKDYKHLGLFSANYDLAKAEGANFVNALFLHLRYNYKISTLLRWEAFTQSQINAPLGLAFRQLTGTGPRFKLNAGEWGNFYLGAAYMFEYEETIEPQPKIHRDSRFSSYVSFSLTIPSINGDIISTAYFQPLFKDISDYRFMNETRIDFRITPGFRVYTRLNYFHDANPPEGIRRNAIGLEQGFGLNIK